MGGIRARVFYDKLETVETIAQKSAERVLRKLGAVKPKSQEVPIVIQC